MLKDNVCYQKAFNYSIKIVKVYKKLTKNKKEYVMSKFKRGNTRIEQERFYIKILNCLKRSRRNRILVGSIEGNRLFKERKT